jgi:RhtB (resistance to homoserine/threonine) family protein
MSYLVEFATVAAVHLLAVASPGPDFALVTKNSLAYSRRAGVYSAIGVGLGILVHVAYSLIGIGVLMAQSILLFSLVKFLGAGYLIYIGWKSLRAKPVSTLVLEANAATGDLTPVQAVRMGFLTNALNPKATLFFLSLFTQVISPATPKPIQIGYGLEMCLATMVWFSLLATLLSHPRLRARIRGVQHYVERAFGVILIGLGIKVALSTHK